jgi:thiol-disulfide isomerase/thioredoxin
MIVLTSVLSLLACVLSVFATSVAVASAKRVDKFTNPESVGAGLAAGALVPPAAMRKLAGGRSDRDDPPALLVTFLSESCPPCRELLDSLAMAENHIRTPLLIVVVDTAAPTPRELPAFDVTWLSDPDRQLQAQFQSRATPHTFLIGGVRVVDQIVGMEVERLLNAAESLDRSRPATAT